MAIASLQDWFEAEPEDHQWVFGEFIFDAHKRELRRNGKKIELNPQPLRLLKILLVNAPETVTRDTLQRELWGDKLTVEFEQSLNTCVGQLRTAFGESAKEPVFIITEPKIGYRFIAPVAKANGKRPLYQKLGLLAGAGIVISAFLLSVLRDGGSPPPLLGVQIDNPQVHELVLRARSLRLFGDPSAMAEGYSYLEQALEIDPHEPETLGGAALNLAVLGGQQGFPVRASYDKARGLAEQSIRGDAPSVDGLLARGFIALYDRWDIGAARSDFEEAVSRAPNYAIAHSWLAAALAADGDVDAAVLSAQRAADINPVAWVIHADRCWYLVFQRNYDRAEEICAGAVELEPGRLWPQLGLMEAYRASGKFDAAADLLRQFAAQAGASTMPARSDDGAADFARASCAMAEALAKRDPAKAPNYLIAAFYAQCGEHGAAAKWLKNSMAGGESFVLFYASDPRFDVFRQSDIGRATPIKIAKISR